MLVTYCVVYTLYTGRILQVFTNQRTLAYLSLSLLSLPQFRSTSFHFALYIIVHTITENAHTCIVYRWSLLLFDRTLLALATPISSSNLRSTHCLNSLFSYSNYTQFVCRRLCCMCILVCLHRLLFGNLTRLAYNKVKTAKRAVRKYTMLFPSQLSLPPSLQCNFLKCPYARGRTHIHNHLSPHHKNTNKITQKSILISLPPNTIKKKMWSDTLDT